MQAATKHPSFATFGLLLGATVWGIIWYPYRLLEQAGIAGVYASIVTYGLAWLAGICLLGYRQHLFSNAKSFAMLALVAGWTNLSYVLAIIDGEVMRVMLLFYLSPLWTLLLAWLLLNEKTGLRGMSVILLSLGGAVVMLWAPSQGFPLPRNAAEWLGLSSGMGFALTNVLTRRFTHLTLPQKSFAVWVGVAGIALMFLPFEHTPMPDWRHIGWQHWLLMGALGIVLMVTTLMVQYGITHTLVTRAAVIFLFELVVAAVFSYWLAKEALSLREWMGGIMIVAATLFAPEAEDTD